MRVIAERYGLDHIELYGYQSRESVRQAVIDAGYKGPTLDYHP